MKIALYQVGKTSFGFIDQGITEYERRIAKYVPFEIIIFPDERYTKSKPLEKIRRTEGETLLKRIKETDYLILLDENGKKLNSVNFSKFIEAKMQISKQKIVFVIGGAYGFSKEIYNRADDKIALSEMTFSHQLVRVIFLEQLYRAFTILNNEPYHH